MTVLNKHRDRIPAAAIYIGRGSPWGNPFKIEDGVSRDKVIMKYQGHLEDRIRNEPGLIQQLADLHGKDLVCFCAPLACHGHVLEHYAREAVNHLHRNPSVPGIGE